MAGVPGSSFTEKVFGSDKIIRVGVVGAGEVAQTTHVWTQAPHAQSGLILIIAILAPDSRATFSPLPSRCTLRRLAEATRPLCVQVSHWQGRPIYRVVSLSALNRRNEVD